MKNHTTKILSARLLSGAAALSLLSSLAYAQTLQSTQPHPLTAEQPSPFGTSQAQPIEGDSPIPPTVASSTSVVTPSTATIPTNNSYVTGGVGKVERETLEATANQYNLKVETAYNSGHYISDAHISILDKNGTSVIAAMADGPLFYAKLEPGSYTVKANYHDKVYEKKVTVVATPTTPKRLVFTWETPAS